ncbi:MAG: cyclase family protein [Acidimicrobiales bacterium]
MRLQYADLSHVVEHGTITYPGLPPPEITDHQSFEDSAARYAAGTEFRINRIAMVGNTGTYIDSPAHRIRGGADLAELALEMVAGVPGLVVDTAGAPLDAEQLPASATALSGRAVLVRTGWDRHWGGDHYGAIDHPYVNRAAAKALAAAGVALVGIDSVNIDATTTGERPAHTALLRAGIPIVEHLCGLEQLPSEGFEFFAVPAKVRGMTSFPVRAFARWPRLA